MIDVDKFEFVTILTIRGVRKITEDVPALDRCESQGSSPSSCSGAHRRHCVHAQRLIPGERFG
jgi:hypothetical protein